MAVKLVSHVLQYLTLDMIEHPSRDHANSHAAFGAAIPGLQARLSNVALRPGVRLPSSKAQGGADGDRLTAIADSLIQPSRGIGVHSKQSHSPWKRCSSRYLRLRLR
jgi:hypothetical protein